MKSEERVQLSKPHKIEPAGSRPAGSDWKIGTIIPVIVLSALISASFILSCCFDLPCDLICFIFSIRKHIVQNAFQLLFGLLCSFSVIATFLIKDNFKIVLSGPYSSITSGGSHPCWFHTLYISGTPLPALSPIPINLPISFTFIHQIQNILGQSRSRNRGNIARIFIRQHF